MTAKKNTAQKEAKPSPFSVPAVHISTPKGKQLHLTSGLREGSDTIEDEHASDQFESEEF